MKNTHQKTLLRTLIAVAFFLGAGLLRAAEKPVDAASVVGRWVLVDVKSKDPAAKEALLGHMKFVMIFRADKTYQADVTSTENAPTETKQSKKGTYRVSDGQIFVSEEGGPKDDPAKAVIRDGKLVVLPPDDTITEIIFEKTDK